MRGRESQSGSAAFLMKASTVGDSTARSRRDQEGLARGGGDVPNILKLIWPMAVVGPGHAGVEAHNYSRRVRYQVGDACATRGNTAAAMSGCRRQCCTRASWSAAVKSSEGFVPAKRRGSSQGIERFLAETSNPQRDGGYILYYTSNSSILRFNTSIIVCHCAGPGSINIGIILQSRSSAANFSSTTVHSSAVPTVILRQPSHPTSLPRNRTTT